MDNKKQITVFEDPCERLSSQYGLVTWAEWLRKEQGRFLAAKIKTEIITRANGQTALVRLS